MGLPTKQKKSKCYEAKGKDQFAIGDKVRVSRIKGIFEKGYVHNWSEEIFTIDGVKHIECEPTTYTLEEYNGEKLKGCFYPEELQKTELGDIFSVEKVIERKGKKMLVKWLGWPKKYNIWIDKENVVD